MLCINDSNTDPYFNLAAEEYVLKNFSENIFMLWRNSRSVIVGRYQNSLAEINTDYVRSNGIKVVRRLSGGGAVFHDLGNINFTFIENAENSRVIDFGKYTQPVIDVLRTLDIDAHFEGRNDLVIDGMKFSGNAEHIFHNRVLHHGTLLFSSELSDISGALNAHPAKFTGKAVKSVRSRVTNISSHLKSPVDIETFREMLLNHAISGSSNSVRYSYTDDDLAAIRQLRDEKYRTWEWNFGQSPGYSMVKNVRTGGGNLELHIDVKDGMMQQVRIFGDFFNIEDTAELELLLAGAPHSADGIRQRLEHVHVADYIVNVTLDELVDGLL